MKRYMGRSIQRDKYYPEYLDMQMEMLRGVKFSLPGGYRDYLSMVADYFSELSQFVKFQCLLLEVETHREPDDEKRKLKTYVLKNPGVKVNMKEFVRAGPARMEEVTIREHDITVESIVNILKQHARDLLPHTIPVLARAFSNKFGLKVAARDIAHNPNAPIDSDGWFFGSKNSTVETGRFDLYSYTDLYMSILKVQDRMQLEIYYGIFFDKWADSSAGLFRFREQMHWKGWETVYFIECD